MEPCNHGRELSIGDELGLGVTPDCCGEEMTAAGHTYTCGNCRTVLTVDALGLVSDIR